MSAPGGIPPYGERDHELAQAALRQVGIAPYPGPLREVAGAVATARAEGRRAAYLTIAGRLDEMLPAFGIRAGREVRAIIAELRLSAERGVEVQP